MIDPQPTAGEIGPDLVHRLAIRVYFEDTDFSGIVYHARYLHFCERGRSDYVRLIGVSHAELFARPEPLAFAVREMTVTWLAPARIDDALVVETSFEAVKGARFFMSQRIRRGDQTLVSARMEAVVMTQDGRPRRLPTDVADRMTPYLRPSACDHAG